MADITPVHRAILQRLISYTSTTGMQVYDGKVPDGEEIPKMPAPGGIGPTQVKPHVCLQMGDDRPHPWGANIANVEDTLGILPFTVLCVANDNLAVSQVRDLVKRALVGFIPTTDCGVIEGNGGLADQPVASLLKPQRYMRALGFHLSVGANGAPA